MQQPHLRSPNTGVRRAVSSACQNAAIRGRALVSSAETFSESENNAVPFACHRTIHLVSRMSGRIGGPGLAIWRVKNLVGEPGGRIAAYSVEVKWGSTFRVFFSLMAWPSAPLHCEMNAGRIVHLDSAVLDLRLGV